MNKFGDAPIQPKYHNMIAMFATLSILRQY